MIDVLIVEDDPMVAQFNRHYLEQVEGFRCAGTAASVEEAERFLENSSPQLILLDLYLRQQGGLELLNRLRSRAENVDVIVISAVRDPELIRKTMQYGAMDYLIKPFQFSRFREALESYKETSRAMSAESPMSQLELDILMNKKLATPVKELPKGLTKGTLQAVWDTVQVCSKDGFSTDDAAKLSGISRVSVRKYLDFLTSLGALEIKVVYGTGGRPLDLFLIHAEHRGMVEVYLS